MNINHSWRTEAPGGLDIRYNLDLIKVITKPTPAGLEILSRLTGISFADVDLGGNSLDHRATFQMFVEQCCVQDLESRVHSPELFQRYLEWTDPIEVMTETKFHEVAQTFFKRIKNSVYYYVGVRFVKK